MAKKTVATLHEGSKDGRAYTKVIKMVKSPKTGAYIFDEQMVPNEAVKDFFKNWLYYWKYKIRLQKCFAALFFLISFACLENNRYLCRIEWQTSENGYEQKDPDSIILCSSR